MSVSFSQPRSIVLQMGLSHGARVADLGSGTGHYAQALAGVVGREGKVYAVDVQEDVLKHAKINAHQHHTHTIETVWGDIEKKGGTHLRDALVDGVVLANVLFQVEHREAVAQEALRILKPGGIILVVDWVGSFGGIGPRPDQVIGEEAVVALFSALGCTKRKSVAAGSHHYGVILQAP